MWCVMNSAVAAQPWSPPKRLQGPLMVISEKNYFDVSAHPEVEWFSQKHILIFSFYYFTIF